MSKRNKHKWLSSKDMRESMALAVKNLDKEHLDRVRRTSRPVMFARTLRSEFTAAIKREDKVTGEFIRDGGLSLQSWQFYKAIKDQSTMMVDWMISGSTDREKKNIVNLQSFVQAMASGMHDLARKLAEDGALERSQGNRKIRPISYYAICTGDIENIDLVLSLAPKQATPKLFNYVLGASLRLQPFEDASMKQITNQKEIIEHLLSRGVSFQGQIAQSLYNKDYLAEALKRDEGLKTLFELMRHGAPYDGDYFRRCALNRIGANDNERKNYLDNSILPALTIFDAVRKYNTLDHYLDLNAIGERVDALKSNGSFVSIRNLKEMILGYIEDVRADYFSEMSGNDALYRAHTPQMNNG